MVVTGFVTKFTVDSLQLTDDYVGLWLLLISRGAIAAILYYAVMRLAGTVILQECLTFLKKL